MSEIRPCTHGRKADRPCPRCRERYRISAERTEERQEERRKREIEALDPETRRILAALPTRFPAGPDKSWRKVVYAGKVPPDPRPSTRRDRTLPSEMADSRPSRRPTRP